MLIHLTPRAGRLPAINNRMLPAEASSVATNVIFTDGTLNSIRNVSTVATPTKVGTKKAIYYAPVRSGVTRYWYHWLDAASVAESPVEDQVEDIAYIAGDSTASGKMRYTTLVGAVTGGTNYPMASWDLGVATPVAAPSLAIAGTGAGLPLDVAYGWRYVAKTAGGISMPGSISAIATIERETGETVNVTMPTTYSGGGTHQVTHKQIFRTVPGDASGLYYFVAEVTLATAVYNDAITDDAVQLARTLEHIDLQPPPDNVHSIVMLPNGISVVASGREVRASYPFMPHAYPSDYGHSCDFTIVGLGVIGLDGVVLTTGTPYILRGSNPAFMTMDRTSVTQSCVSRRSIVSTKYGVIYACPDGLNVIRPGEDRLLTANVFDRQTWQSLNPSSIIGVVYKDMYFGFYDTGSTQAGFVLDVKNGHVVDIDTYATAAFVDPIDDSLYLQVGSDIIKWEGVAHDRPTTTIVTTGNCVYSNGSITKVGGTPATFDSSGYSANSVAEGSSIYAVIGNTNADIIFGLNDAPSFTSSYTDINFAFSIAIGNVYVFEAGVGTSSSFGALATSDVLRIKNDTTYIRYYKNNTLLKSTAVAPGATYYFDSSFAKPSDTISSISIGEYGKTITYKSPKLRVTKPPTAVRVVADSYCWLLLKIYGDGVLKATKIVASDDIIRLPDGYRPSIIEVQLEGQVIGLSAIYLSDSVAEIEELGG